MEEDAAEEEQRQTKRPAEDDGAEGSAKRPKPPPSPTEWWEADTATAELVHGVREELATLRRVYSSRALLRGDSSQK